MIKWYALFVFCIVSFLDILPEKDGENLSIKETICMVFLDAFLYVPILLHLFDYW